jgi:DNA-binding response OmpR family regulator
MATRLSDQLSPEEVALLSGKKALIVEDELLVGMELAQTLESWGIDVAGPVPTLDQASRQARTGDWDFVILDVDLDGVSSLTLARELTQMGVPIVFVSAHADETDRFSGELASLPRIGKPARYQTLRRVLIDSTHR